MQYAILGKTKLRVSRLGFGCMRFPMRGEHVDRDLSIPLLRRAVELGVNYFDSAVGYCNQESQRVVGEAFEGMRDRVILSTKNPFYNKKDEKTWWTNLENSLERLRTDHIDLYNFHGLNWKAFQEHVDGPDGQLRWMQRAKDDGRIRHIGFSFHDKMENLKKLAGTGLFEAVTLQYNLLDRSNEPAFEFVGDKCGTSSSMHRIPRRRCVPTSGRDPTRASRPPSPCPGYARINFGLQWRGWIMCTVTSIWFVLVRRYLATSDYPVIDGATSHPTRQPKGGCQVVGYPAQAGIQRVYSICLWILSSLREGLFYQTGFRPAPE